MITEYKKHIKFGYFGVERKIFGRNLYDFKIHHPAPQNNVRPISEVSSSPKKKKKKISADLYAGLDSGRATG